MELNTVWSNSGINDYDGAIKTKVDDQDNTGIEDYGEDGVTTSTAIGNTAMQMVNNIGVVKDISNLFGASSITNLGDIDREPAVPKKTDHDKNFKDILAKAKTKNYKNIKMSSKIGTFAGINTLLGSALGLYVGALGKSSLSNMIDETAVKFAGGANSRTVSFLAGLGVGSLEKLNGISERMPTAGELTSLLIANYYNMYENKPGRLVKDKFNKYNFVDYNTVDGIDGSKKDDSIAADILGGILKAPAKALGFASDIVSGKLVSKKLDKWLNGDRKGEDEDKLLGKTIIISNQRSGYESFVGKTAGGFSKIKEDKNGNQSKDGKLKHASLVLGMTPQQWIDTDEVKKGFVSEVYNRVNSKFRRIGGLYVEPFQSDGNIQPCFIPFEFNPTITGDSLEAKYNTEDLMGRILSVRSYVGSDAGNLTLETQYLVLTDDRDIDSIKDKGGKDSEGNGDSSYFSKMQNGGEKAFYNDNMLQTQQWLNGWMTDWTQSTLAEIEKAYRSLTLPYIDSGIFVRPPIVRIHMTTTTKNSDIKVKIGEKEDSKTTVVTNLENFYNSTVGDLFSYPVSNTTESKLEPLYITGTIDKCRRIKRYIVTNVDISSISEDWGLNYSLDGALRTDGFSADYYHYKRNGFKVTLSLAETTKNFLDVIPNYRHYHNGLNGLTGGSSPNNFGIFGESTGSDDGSLLKSESGYKVDCLKKLKSNINKIDNTETEFFDKTKGENIFETFFNFKVKDLEG